MEPCIYMTRENIPSWERFLKSSIKFLDLNRGLLDSYVLDFFVDEVWEKLNPKWGDVLNAFGPSDLATFLSSDTELVQKQVWPLSLLAFRASAFTYTLPRKSVSSLDFLTQYLKRQTEANKALVGTSCEISLKRNADERGVVSTPTCTVCASCDICSEITTEGSKCCSSLVAKNDEILKKTLLEGNEEYTESSEIISTHKGSINHETMDCETIPEINLSRQEKMSSVALELGQQIPVRWGDAASELSAAAGQHKLLQHVFRRHLKPKKQHEVARLALVAGEVARAGCGGVLVDVGSGQGHLSRLLAYGHRLRLVCLEAEEDFIKGAKKFDNQLENAVEKMKRRQTVVEELPAAPRHAVCLLQPHMEPHTFTEVVTGAWPDLRSKGGLCGLLGLHTCGNLACTLLRIFTNMTSCQALVSVACCYMKISTDGDEKEYPMSQCVEAIPGHELSYAAREVACHAIEMYTRRLHQGADNLKVHCYRAVLEQIIVRHWPHHRRAGLRSVNHTHTLPFPRYAKEAVSKIPEITLPEEDLTSDQTQENLTRWMQVVVYYCLRLLLAPVVESVILLDRQLFLCENDVENLLFPVFDPQMSPRNHALVAVKSQNKT